MHRAPQSRLLRLGRKSEPGRHYLLTTRALGRPFSNFRAACVACRALTDSRVWGGSVLLAWVLMPDHWHGLIRLGRSETLAICMLRMKSSVARAANRDAHRSGRVWQDGYHDRALCASECLLDVARYIVLNPVRAGLAASPSDYPFWDNVWLGHWGADARLSHRGHGPLPLPPRRGFDA